MKTAASNHAQDIVRMSVIPLLLSVLAVLIFCLPELRHSLQLDIGAISTGRMWLLLTGHFTHWSVSHLFWDVLMFFGLGLLCYRHSKSSFWGIVIVGPILISLAVIICYPEITLYRGLSGIDSALFLYFVAVFIQKSYQIKDKLSLASGFIMLTLFVGKTVYELITGQVLFVATTHFTPLPLSHLAGMFVGLLFFVLHFRQKKKHLTRSARK